MAQRLEYNDHVSRSSISTDTETSSLHKPIDHLEEEGEDDVFINSTPRKRWWTMPLRARRRNHIVTEADEDADEGLIEMFSTRRKRKPRRTWFHYCVFGGISGCAILYVQFPSHYSIPSSIANTTVKSSTFFLLTNLLLILTTYLLSPHPDTTLSNWGRPGSSTSGLSWYPTSFLRDVVPIACHSHNDYWRRVPLFSALRAGCIGVEADVWLFDNELYVGHNTASLTRNRTFQALYVNPLVKILEDKNPASDFYNGSANGVFDTDPEQTLTLLIDVKTSGAETWPWVLAQLAPLREKGWLSFVENGVVTTRPITVVGTGETPFDVLTANTTYRDAFFDAPLSSLSSPTSSSGQGLTGTSSSSSFTTQNSYYASVSFSSAIGRLWNSRLSEKQIETIRRQVKEAHDRGLKARYWDLPSWPRGLRNHVWEVLVREGVDLLNVDDLRGVRGLGW